MPYFFLRLNGPRPTFPADMTAAEKVVMQDHSTYWRGLAEKGTAVVFGPVLDPNGPYGMGIVAVADDSGARAFADADPAITAGIGFRCEISPMRAITRDTPLN